MLRWSWVVVALFFGACSCGDDPPECVIDTDCPNIHERCGANGRCMAFGVPDSGGGRDSGRRDAGRVDAGRDAGGADSGPLDAGGPCDLRTGSYSAGTVLGACGSAAPMGTFTSARLPADACTLMLTSTPGMSMLDGSVMVADDGTFTGMSLTVGGLAMSCMGDLEMSMITISCTNPSDGSMCTIIASRSM